ncbi:MAG: ABC transporter permease [Erysipelotrichaceae bacterium]|nr:ABC transporter permease [Erysipelotrichaceae bacterium]
MVKYTLKRFIQAIPIFIGITLIVFVLSDAAPGSPVTMIAGQAGLSDAQVEALKIAYGLDKPVLVRYWFWLCDIFKGNLGISTSTGVGVSKIIGQRLGPSLILSLTSLVISVIVGVLLGILSAYKPYSFWDKLASALAFFGNAVPSFFMALLLIYIFSVKLKVLPASGMYGPGAKDLANLLQHLLLPAIIISLQSVGGYIKQTRGAMLECINEDYIKTARSKGIGEYRVMIHHALRNALIPIITQIGLSVPYLIGGAVVTEQIFGWPGIGSLMVNAVNSYDYNLIMGITVLISIVVLVSNIVLDLVYAALDPRISQEA